MGVYDERPWLKSYDQGVPAEVNLPDEPVTAGYERIRRRFPDRPAFHFFGVTWTFEELFGIDMEWSKVARVEQSQ